VSGSDPSAAAEPKHRSGGIRGLAELAVTIGVAVGVAFLIQAFLVKPYRIPSPSMVPTLEVGQRILVNRLATHPGLGDVVVFHPPAGATNDLGSQCGDPGEGPGRPKPCDRATVRASGQTFVKRVVGLPGDTLKINHGDVYRNGVKETGSYIQACPDPTSCTFSETITVPNGDYYMMGDNRGKSDDSRYWGPVAQPSIIGTAFFTYWPPDRIGTL
jgi:signal peptidase I